MEREIFQKKAEELVIKHVPAVLTSDNLSGEVKNYSYRMSAAALQKALGELETELMGVPSKLPQAEKQEVATWAKGKLEEAYRSVATVE